MKAKKISLPLTVAVIVFASFAATFARSADPLSGASGAPASTDITKLDGQVAQPFEACKQSGVVVLTPQSFAAQQAKLQNCPDCAARVQESLNTGLFVSQVEGNNPQGTVLQATEFMHEVADHYLANLKDNLKYQQDMASCYYFRDQKDDRGQTPLCKLMIDGGSGQYQGADGKSHTVQTPGAEVQMAKAAAEARQNLLMARSDMSSVAGNNEMQGAGVDFSKSLTLNKSLAGCSAFGSVNPFSKVPPTADELAAAQKQLDADEKSQLKPTLDKFVAEKQALHDKAQADGMPEATLVDPATEKNQFKIDLLSRYRAAKCQDYRKTVMEKMPIFAVIDPPKGPNGTWTDGQKSKAYAGLTKNTQDEIARTNRSISDGKLEWALLFKHEGECVPTDLPQLDPSTGVQVGTTRSCVQKSQFDPERAWKNWAKGDRDLLDYLSFKDVVEQVLRDKPQYCGIATGLASHEHYKQTQYAIGTGVGVLAGSVAVAAASPAIAVATGLGISGAGLSAAVGAAAGSAFTLGSVRDYYQTQGQLLSYSGTGQDIGAEHRVRDLADIDAAQSQVILNAAMSAVDVPRLFYSSKMIYAAAARRYLAEDTTRIADAGSDTAKRAMSLKNQALFDQAIGASADDTVKSTVERLAQDWGGANLAQTIRENPKAFEHFQKVLIDANIQGAKEPEEKLAARNMLLFFDKATATTQSWGDEFPALASVMKKMHDNQLMHLRTLKESDPSQYQVELKALQKAVDHPDSQAALARNAQDFDQALKEMGVTDDSTRSKMGACWRSAAK